MVKMSVLPEFIYRFNKNPIKIQKTFLVEVDKLIPKDIWRTKRLRKANTIFFIEFKTFYKLQFLNQCDINTKIR